MSSNPLAWKVVSPVLLAFGLVSAIGLYHHELFLDEAHHFLLARDSRSLVDMYFNARYDGHPRLWHTLLFVITHFITRDPAGMQVFHWLIMMAAALVFLRYSPFSLTVKLLVLSGYYFLYEYNLLSRSYSLGILLLFLGCVLLSEGRLYLLGVVVFFMCSTHLFFAFASIGIFLFMLIDRIIKREAMDRKFWVFCGLFFLGFACAVIQAQTPVEDNVNMSPVHATGFLSLQGVSFAFNGLVRGWLPVPGNFDGHFWNSYWPLGLAMRLALFVGFFAAPYFFLRKDWRSLVFYYTSVALLLLFFSVTQMTASRYFGMVFVFFLVALWIGGGLPSVPVVFRVGFFGVLVVQVVVGVYAWVEDYRLPFSESRDVVAFLEGHGLAGEEVVIDGYNSGPMLAAYLKRDVFYLATGRLGSFCTWKKRYFPSPRPSIKEELARCPELGGRFILVSNRDLGSGGAGLTKLAVFANSIIREDFFIYQFSQISE